MFALPKNKNNASSRELRKIYTQKKTISKIGLFLKISWCYIYFTGCQTYLPVVLNLDFYDTSPYPRGRPDLNFLTAPDL